MVAAVFWIIVVRPSVRRYFYNPPQTLSLKSHRNRDSIFEGKIRRTANVVGNANVHKTTKLLGMDGSFVWPKHCGRERERKGTSNYYSTVSIVALIQKQHHLNSRVATFISCFGCLFVAHEHAAALLVCCFERRINDVLVPPLVVYIGRMLACLPLY